jgi:hypothetical protein
MAREAAEVERDHAAMARDIAEVARGHAESAREEAEVIREHAEAARDYAEAVREHAVPPEAVFEEFSKVLDGHTFVEGKALFESRRAPREVFGRALEFLPGLPLVGSRGRVIGRVVAPGLPSDESDDSIRSLLQEMRDDLRAIRELMQEMKGKPQPARARGNGTRNRVGSLWGSVPSRAPASFPADPREPRVEGQAFPEVAAGNYYVSGYGIAAPPSVYAGSWSDVPPTSDAAAGQSWSSEGLMVAPSSAGGLTWPSGGGGGSFGVATTACETPASGGSIGGGASASGQTKPSSN